MKHYWLITILLSLVFGVIGFFVGLKYQKNQQINNLKNFSFRQQNLVTNGKRLIDNRLRGRSVIGEIIKIDDKLITIKLNNESNKIILYSEKTEVNKLEKSNIKELEKGDKIIVFGEEDKSGLINAINIQINPNFINR